jgi:hypothetical protein
MCIPCAGTMASLHEPAFVTTLIILLFNAYDDLGPYRLHADHGAEDSDDEMNDVVLAQEDDPNMATMNVSSLHTYRLCNLFFVFNEDLGYWVKPRSTTWFTRFLMEQYEDDCWFESLRMSKVVVFNLKELLRSHILKRDTRYRLAVRCCWRRCHVI